MVPHGTIAMAVLVLALATVGTAISHLATRGAPQRDALADEGRREQVLRLAHVHPRRGRSAGWVIGG